MEQKLAEFRSRRRREELKNKVIGMLSSVNPLSSRNSAEMEMQEQEEPLINNRPKIASPKILPSPPEPERLFSRSAIFRNLSPLSSPEIDTTSEESIVEEDDSSDNKTLTRMQWMLFIALWFTLLLIVYEFGFTLPYLVISTILFIYINTGTAPKKIGEPSAYSVFNPNCESIEGTTTAEQFEREIRYGPASVR